MGWSNPSAAAASIAPLVVVDANTVAQKNGTNSQIYRLYGTFTGSADAWAEFNHSLGGNLTISTKQNGAGAAGSITLSAGTNSAVLGPNGYLTAQGFIGAIDGFYVGTNGASNTYGFKAVSLTSDTLISWSSTTNATSGKDLALARNSAGVAELNSGVAGTYRDLKLRDLVSNPSSSKTPAVNGELVVEATSNTTLTFKLKGSDGVVRSATLTLA